MAEQHTTENLTEYPVQALQRFKPFEAELTTAASETAGLTINGPDDASGYEVVQKAIARLTGLRTGIEKARVEIKAPALEFGRKVDKEAKRLTDIVQRAEAALRNEKARIDEIRADEQRAKDRAEMELFKQRADKLFEVGFVFDGADYIAGSLHILAAGLVGLTDKKFDECLELGAQEIAKEKARKQQSAPAIEFQTNVLPDVHIEQETPPNELNPDVQVIEAQLRIHPDLNAKLTAALPLPTDSPDVIASKMFSAGFETCRQNVLQILESPEKFTREQLRAAIRALKCV